MLVKTSRRTSHSKIIFSFFIKIFCHFKKLFITLQCYSDESTFKTYMIMEIKLADKSELKARGGSCFHHVFFYASVNELKTILGNENVGKSIDGKTKHEWLVKDNEDRYFSIYDYKYPTKYGNDESIIWHIGSKYNSAIEQDFANEILKRIKELRQR